MWPWTHLNRCQQYPSPVATVRTDQRLVAYTAQSHCYTFPGDEKCEHVSHWVKTKMPAQLHTSSDSERESCSFSLLLSRRPVLLGYCPLTLSITTLQSPLLTDFSLTKFHFDFSPDFLSLYQIPLSCLCCFLLSFRRVCSEFIDFTLFFMLMNIL